MVEVNETIKELRNKRNALGDEMNKIQKEIDDIFIKDYKERLFNRFVKITYDSDVTVYAYITDIKRVYSGLKLYYKGVCRNNSSGDLYLDEYENIYQYYVIDNCFKIISRGEYNNMVDTYFNYAKKKFYE